MQSSFQGFQMMSSFSSIDMVRMILVLAISFIFFKFKMGLLSPVIAYLITPLILISIYLPLLLGRNKAVFAKSKFGWDAPLFRKLCKYGLQMVFLTVGAVLLGHVDRLMLTYYRTLGEVGIYSAVFPTAMIFSYIPFAIGKVLLPITSELWSKGLITEFKKGVELLYRFFLIVMIPTSFLIFTFSDFLLGIFYGAGYVAGSFALKILALSSIFLGLGSINGNILSGIGQPRTYTIIILIGTVANIILNMTLIPSFGISGAAAATGLSFILMMLIGFYILTKKRFAVFPYSLWGKTLVVSIAFLLIVHYMNRYLSMNLFIKIPLILLVSGAFYLIALFLFRLVSIAEIKELLQRLKAE